MPTIDEERAERKKLNEKHLSDLRKRLDTMPVGVLAHTYDVACDESDYQKARLQMVKDAITRRGEASNASVIDAGEYIIERKPGALETAYVDAMIDPILAAARENGENTYQLAMEAIAPNVGYKIDKTKLNRLAKFGGDLKTLIDGFVVQSRKPHTFVVSVAKK